MEKKVTAGSPISQNEENVKAFSSVSQNDEKVKTFFKENSEVRIAQNTDIKSYLKTTLFNAPSTYDSYYTAEVNHDFHGTE